MDRKAQIQLGWIVVAFIAVVVGLSFWSLMGSNIGQMTKTSTSTNALFTMGTGVAKELTPCGQKVLTISLVNNSDSVAIQTGNYTTSVAAGSDGYLAAFIKNNTAQFGGQIVNVTCTYEPKGYISDGGSRAVVTLIAVMMAILIMVSAMPDLRKQVIDFFGS